jgi:hypothetical protein
MIQKQVLVPGRVRRPPADGWSWIDRRFLREHAARLSHEASVLYFFPAAVSDKDGLSFYGDASIALRLWRGQLRRTALSGSKHRQPCLGRLDGGTQGALGHNPHGPQRPADVDV